MRSATQVVVPGLFIIGCVPTAVDFCEIKKGTHVLTILNEELVPVLGSDIQHMVVYIYMNMEEKTMLLNHLDDCITFIKKALSGKASVFVHCFAGVPRSSTVGWIDKETDWVMGVGIKLKKKLLIDMGDLVEEASAIENAPNEEDVALSQDSLFRCRKCGWYQNLDPLNPSGDEPHESASSVFVEPLSWIKPKALSKGKSIVRNATPNWAHSSGQFRCNKGRIWNVAFQLHLKNLDEVSSKPVESLSHRVRQPRFGSAPKQPEKTLQNKVKSTKNSGSRGFDSFIFEALRLGILEATGVDIPHQFPTDFNEVFGMDIQFVWSIMHESMKDETDWMEDIEALLTKVSIAKEKAYKEMTAAGTSAFPGVTELIKKLMAFGVPFGVGSSGSPEKINRNIQSAGLSGSFPDHKIVSAKMVNRGKPAPDIYIEVLRRLECRNPSRSLVIEDLINGLKAGEAAGAYTVGITTSFPREKIGASC
ncbi:hypothetical protein BSKO_09375 [Bryopsis sp. KO-2023]|nr:hypothetical protein BSKO_09375 [Bryopsis sp. KO-2023]